jgi:nucleoside phosphorylase
LIASGDQFVSSRQASAQLRADLEAAGHAVLAVEMEGAAVAQTCLDYGTPFAAMRTISDRADDSAHVDFRISCARWQAATRNAWCWTFCARRPRRSRLFANLL